MKQLILLLICMIFAMVVRADNRNPGDQRTTVLKTESNWTKTDVETTTTPAVAPNVITIVEGISYYSSNEGLFLTLTKSASNIKLFSLTGEVVWQGNLVQGRFLIPTRQGIYFLRINNKSYKIICR
jgi:hypothetical protein